NEDELMYFELISEKLRYYFSSWDEAYDNYLDGYAWWSRADISNERLRESYWIIMRGFYPDVFCDDYMFS
ncbi:MAG: hypothetical protein FWG88_11105, partial [Oscillospiraceae bacterium]|nr:hypothetical protein [Oscillospiraceae bacterium]